MHDRFFSETPLAGTAVTLQGPEAHHLGHVLRAAPGDEIVVFDGRGAEFLARIESLRRDQVELILIERRDISREAARPLTLAVALPKGERQRWLIEKGVELGVARLIPLVTQRGVAQPTPEAVARLRRAVIEASKQCGRNRLMDIAEPVTLDMLLRDRPAAAAWIAHPLEAVPLGQQVALLEPAQPVAIAVGPEGGFTDEEIAAARAAEWTAASLGERILRIETAALAAAAVVLSRD